MDTGAVVGLLIEVLVVKERLLMESLQDGVMLPRDNPEFLSVVDAAENLVNQMEKNERRLNARRTLGHIRQFNPFNTSDMDENDMLSEVIEDFLSFTRDRIEKIKVS